MSDLGTTNASKLANSVILTLIARAAILLATVVFLPLAGWMIQRGVSSVDEVSHKVDFLHTQSMETNGTVKLIQQTQGQQTQIIADHEARVRGLESINRRTGASP